MTRTIRTKKSVPLIHDLGLFYALHFWSACISYERSSKQTVFQKVCSEVALRAAMPRSTTFSTCVTEAMLHARSLTSALQPCSKERLKHSARRPALGWHPRSSVQTRHGVRSTWSPMSYCTFFETNTRRLLTPRPPRTSGAARPGTAPPPAARATPSPWRAGRAAAAPAAT